MSRKAIVFVVLVSFALPLTASASPGRQDQQDSRAERFLTALWERLTAPFSALLDGALPVATTPADTVPPPPPPAGPGVTTDGRSILDPIG